MDLHLRWGLDWLAKFGALREKGLSPITYAFSQASGKILALTGCLLLAWITSEWADRQTVAEIQTKNLPSRLALATVLQRSGYTELDEPQIHRLNLKNHFPLIGKSSPSFWKTENMDWIAYLHPALEDQLREMVIFTRLQPLPGKAPAANEWIALEPLKQQLEWMGFLETFLSESPLSFTTSKKILQKPLFPARNGVWHHPRELKY